MKNLLFILLLFSGYVHAQDQTIGRRGNRVVVLGRLGIDSIDYSNTITDTVLFRAADGTIKKARINSSSAIDKSTKVLSGSVIWDSLFIFSNTIINYQILGRIFSTSSGTITLTASNPSLERRDIIYADTLGNIGVLEGVNGSGTYPTIDPASQIELLQVDIPAASTKPFAVANNTIYKENIEWTGTSNISGADFAYTTLPYAGLYSTYFPSFTNGQYFDFQDAGTHEITDYGYIKFYIRLSSAWISSYLSVKLNDGTTKRTNYLTILNGQYGFASTLINTWQLVVIPISDFAFATPETSFDKVVFGLNGSGGAFQIDNIQLQTGGIIAGTVVNTFNGQSGNVIGNFVDSGRYSADTSLIEFYNKYTGSKLFSLPSYLANIYSSDTCIVMDSISPLRYAIHLNPYCRGSGGGLSSDSVKQLISDSILAKLNISDTVAMLSHYQPLITTSEQVLHATASQTAFTFTSVPATYSNYLIFVNGGLWYSTTGYTTSGNIVTLTTPLDFNDTVILRRTK